MDILGTVDILANRISKLRIRYKNWISNPEAWDNLHEELLKYSNHLKNVKEEVESCTSLNPKKRRELNDCIESVKQCFEKAKQDLDTIEEHLSQTRDENALDAQYDQDVQDANHNDEITPNIGSSSTTNYHSTVMKSGNKQFQRGIETLRKGTKGIKRAIRDTEILDSISKHVGDAKHTLLSISNFIYHHKDILMVLKNRNAPTFHKYFVKPFRSVNWVANFNLTETNIGHDTSSVPKNTTSHSSSTHLTHEQKVKQKLMAFHQSLPQASSTNTQTHQQNCESIPSLCVHGQGGMGKSVTLQSICYDKDIQAKFEDGIHFLLFGQNATKQDAIKEITDCVRNAGYEDLAAELKSNDNIFSIARECSKVFEGKRILFVVDDLWVTEWSDSGFLEQVITLGSGTSGGCILFSTRDRSLVNEGSDDVEFGTLEAKGEESESILRSYMQQRPGGKEDDLFSSLNRKGKYALGEVLELCGGWKLCLGIAGGALREDVRDCGNDVNGGMMIYVEMLREDREMLIREKTPTYNNLITVAESSIRRCGEWEKKSGIAKNCDGELSIEEMFRSLCVIEKQKWVDVNVLYEMWGVGRRYGEMVVKQFSRMNLMSRRRGSERREEDLNDGEQKSEKKNEKSDKKRDGNRERYDSGGDGYELRMDDCGWMIKVHDRMIDVCNDMCEEKDKKEGGGSKWHNQLLDNCIERGEEVSDVSDGSMTGTPRTLQGICTGGDESGSSASASGSRSGCREWWDEKKVSGRYMMRNLSRHLVSGGRWKELYELVTDVRWTLRRRVDGGWTGLEEDMRVLMGEIQKIIKEKKVNMKRGDKRESGSTSEEKKRMEILVEGLEELESILRDSWSRISEGEQEIGFEVYEKVCDAELNYEAIRKYVGSIDRDEPRPWFRPLTKWRRKEDERERARISIPDMGYGNMHVSSDLKYIVGVGKENVNTSRVSIINRETQEKRWIDVERFFEHEGDYYGYDDISSVNFCVKTWNVVVGYRSGKIEVRDGRNSSVKVGLIGHTGGVRCVGISQDGQYIVSGSDDRTVRVWDRQNGKAVCKPLTGHNGFVECVEMSVDGRYIVSGSFDRTVRLWDRKSGKAVCEPFTGHTELIECVGMSGDGRYIVSGSHDKTVRVWNRQSGEPVGEPLTGHNGWVECVGMSGNGRYVVSGSFDGTVRVWDRQNGKAVGEPLTGHTERVKCVGMSGDGRFIVSGSFDGTVRVWHRDSGKALCEPLTGHTGVVECVGVSIDGRYIVSGGGSWDRTVRVWDVNLGTQVGEPFYTWEEDSGGGSYSVVTSYPGWLARQLSLLNVRNAGHDEQWCSQNLHDFVDPVLGEMGYVLKPSLACETADNIETVEKMRSLRFNLDGVWIWKDKWVRVAKMQDCISYCGRGNTVVHGFLSGRILISRVEE